MRYLQIGILLPTVGNCPREVDWSNDRLWCYEWLLTGPVKCAFVTQLLKLLNLLSVQVCVTWKVFTFI